MKAAVKAEHKEINDLEEIVSNLKKGEGKARVVQLVIEA